MSLGIQIRAGFFVSCSNSQFCMPHLERTLGRLSAEIALVKEGAFGGVRMYDFISGVLGREAVWQAQVQLKPCRRAEVRNLRECLWG